MRSTIRKTRKNFIQTIYSRSVCLHSIQNRVTISHHHHQQQQHSSKQQQGFNTTAFKMSAQVSKYNAAYNDPQGPGDARVTALQVVQDEAMINALSDKVFLITGCSSGIGVETARALHATGGRIFVTARDVARTEKVLADLISQGRTTVIQMDLLSLSSVRKGAEEFLEKSAGKLNVLVCNAGIMAVPEVVKSEDGYESQFATNHLAHFLLFKTVQESLLASSTKEFNSRVVMVSSSGHRTPGGIRFGNYNFEEEKGEAYSPWAGYGQAKTANIYMANYIDRHFGPKGLHATSLMPGGIMTPLQKHISKDMMAQWAKDEKIVKSVVSEEQGAATTVWAAIGKEWEGHGGKFLEEVQVGQVKCSLQSKAAI
jgi:NAD(P)-dependent dehydrogenase (short-subunit alcohol dehydrogenase family)